MKFITIALIFMAFSAIYADDCQNGDVLGALKNDQWAPVPHNWQPCPDAQIDLKQKYTISFDYRKVKDLQGDWLEVFRFSKTRNNCCKAGDRMPGLFLHKTGYWHLTLDSQYNHNDWQNTYTSWDNEGKITIVLNKGIFSLYINDKQVTAKQVGNTNSGLVKFFYNSGSSSQNNKGAIETRNWKVQVGKANYPQTIGCNSSPFGQYQTDVWQKVVRNHIPCPNKTIARRSTRYTIDFEYKPVSIHQEWTNIFRMTPKDNRENIHAKSRNPAVWIHPKNYQLHWRQSSSSSPNDGLDTNNYPFKAGNTYKIRLIADSNRFAIVINGVIHRSTWNGNIHEGIDEVTYLSDIHSHASLNQYRNFKLYNNKVLYPGAQHCSSNWAGLYSTNNWNAPIQSLQPCPSTNYQYTNKNTVEFDYKPQSTINRWSNIFRITANSERNNGQAGDRVLALYVIANTYNLHLQQSTSKHVNQSFNVNYNFVSDISYRIKIINNVDRTQVYVNGVQVNNVENGQIKSFGLVKLFISDRYHAAAGALVRNFQFQNGVEPCITVFSECNYKGVSHEVCGDNPDLKQSGFDYVVKSVQIPTDYDRTVTLWTETNYQAKKLELTESAKCIKPDHYTALAQMEGASKNFKQYITFEKKVEKQ